MKTQSSSFKYTQTRYVRLRISSYLFLAAACLTLSNSTSAQEAPAPTPTGGFVTVEGTKLKLNGGDFYFSGANSYSLLYSEADAEEQFRVASNLGLNAIRLWGFWNGEDTSDQLDADGNVIRPGTPDTDVYGHYLLQPRPGVFPEEAWGRLDYVVYLANVYRIKLIIPLLNEWLEFGGIETYLRWADVDVETLEERAAAALEKNNTGYGFHSYDDYLKGVRGQFWTNDKALKLYRNYVRHMLNRKNTYTGVMYKDDPAIMIWEIMNEPRFGPWNKDPDAEYVRDWLSDAADFIKSIDSNHLVGTGEEGFLNQGDHEYGHRHTYPWEDSASGEGVSFVKNAEIPNVDVLGFHCWPFQWSLWGVSSRDDGDPGEDARGEYPNIADFPPEWIDAHVKIAEEVGKPLYLGEFGLQILRREGSTVDIRNEVMQGVYDTARQTNIAGVAYWHMTANHDVDSVTYKGPIQFRNNMVQALFYDTVIPHDNDFKFDIICDGDEITGTEDTTCDIIRDYTAYMTGKVTHPDPLYEPPCLAPKTTCGERCILTDSHPEHCGMCNNPCPIDQSCRQGICEPVLQEVSATQDDETLTYDDGSCSIARVGSRATKRSSIFNFLRVFLF